jgi:hypothetical protein
MGNMHTAHPPPQKKQPPLALALAPDLPLSHQLRKGPLTTFLALAPCVCFHLLAIAMAVRGVHNSSFMRDIDIDIDIGIVIDARPPLRMSLEL